MPREKFTIIKVLVVLLLLTCFAIKANSQITWENYYNTGQNRDCYGNDLCLSTQNNIYFAGGENGIAIVKIDQFGNYIWAKNFDILPESFAAEGSSVISASNDGCIVSGDCLHSYLMRLDKNGNIEWLKFYLKNSNADVLHLERLSNGNILGCGSLANSAGYLIKTDSAGNLIWDKIIQPGYAKTYFSAIESNDTGYIAISNNRTSGNNNQFEITKLDTNGQIIWSKIHAEGIAYNITKVDNMYYISGPGSDHKGYYAFMGKFDNNGDKVFVKKIYFSPVEYYTGSKVLSSSRLLINYFRHTGIIGDTARCLVSIADTSGKILNTRMISNSVGGYNRLEKMMQTKNNEYLILGFGRRNANTKVQMYAIKTDSALQFKPLAINNVNGLMIQNFQLSQNFPNPFNPSTQIQFSIPKSGIVTFKVFNSLGKEIYSDNRYFYSGANQVEYFAENLSSGIYFYSVQFGENIQTRKMILLK